MVEPMQSFRALNRTLLAFSKAACYQTQLPKLTKWHADFVSYSSASQHALSIPVRAFSSIPLSTGKQHLVILGTGWAAARLFRDIDCNYFDVTVRFRVRHRSNDSKQTACLHPFTCTIHVPTGGLAPQSHGIHTTADFGVCWDFGVPECSRIYHVAPKAPQGASEQLLLSVCPERKPGKEGCSLQR